MWIRLLCGEVNDGVNSIKSSAELVLRFRQPFSHSLFVTVCQETRNNFTNHGERIALNVLHSSPRSHCYGIKIICQNDNTMSMARSLT